MVQVRKLVLAIAAATALSSGVAQALGLGELTLRSGANQPLQAEIELLDVRDLAAGDIKSVLAPASEFAKAGVPRPAFLDDLTFTPVINPNGRSLIRITSSRPLSEPLVKFLVEVNWPSGRQLRDYSMLLDASKFSPQAASAAAQPAPTPAVSAPAVDTRANQYSTTPRDTLWDIAAKVGRGGSVQQTMLAIQALNPDAFINGNINLIKAGKVLRLPDPQQSTALPQNQAVTEVARQNAAWREGRRLGPRAQQVDATRRGAGTPAPAPVQPSDKLSLVSGAAGPTPGAAGGRSGDAQALSEKLAVTQENLDTTRRANAELQSRNADLQSQLDKLQKILQLKNDQLARLEAASAPAPLAEATADMPEAAAPEVPAATDPAPVDAQLSPVTPPAPVEAPAADAAAAQPAPEQTPIVADQPPLDTRSDTDKLLANPLLLGLAAGGGVLVLLLVMLLLARRRRAQLEAEKHMRMAKALAEEADLNHSDYEMPSSSFDGLERPSATVQLAPAMVAASVAAAAAAAAVPLPPLRPSAEAPVDVLPEVEQSITLGRLNRAAELLQGALDREPERADLRLKMMEVHARQGDRDGFIAQENRLADNEQNHAQVEDLKSRFPAMLGMAAAAAGAAAAAAQLDADYVKDLLSDEPGAADPIETFDSDFDLSLDDFEDASSPESAEQQAATTPEEAHDLSEFDLDIADAEPAAATDSPHDLARTDDFDLSLSDDPLPAVEPSTTEHARVSADLERLSQSLGKPNVQPFAVPPSLEELSARGDEDDFDFLSGTDEAATKLDLARAYIEMSDNDGARDILEEVLREGNNTQQAEAQDMIARLA
jgi:pilus assembly protein FimV